jgi:ABC-type antimicrobial peptide transport system permease subunit
LLSACSRHDAEVGRSSGKGGCLSASVAITHPAPMRGDYRQRSTADSILDRACAGPLSALHDRWVGASSVARLSGGGTSFAAYALRRLLRVAAVIVLAPSLSFVVLGTLCEGTPLWTVISDLPRYLSDTFLHLELGYDGFYQKQRSALMFERLPVDVALLAGGLVLGVGIGLATGLASARRRGQPLDHALSIGSAAGLSIPIYWFGFAVLALFAPQSGYLLQIPFLSWYGGYVSPGQDPLGWLQSLWVPWLVLAIPLAAMCHRMARASLVEVMNADHVRTARAKGLREAVVMRRHALRAALPPVLGLVSVSVALMVTNVILIETAFNLPGFFRQAHVGR